MASWSKIQLRVNEFILPYVQLGFHSFCKSGVSFLYANQVSLAHLKQHGTLFSDAIYSYLNNSATAGCATTKLLLHCYSHVNNYTYILISFTRSHNHSYIPHHFSSDQLMPTPAVFFLTLVFSLLATRLEKKRRLYASLLFGRVPEESCLHVLYLGGTQQSFNASSLAQVTRFRDDELIPVSGLVTCDLQS